MVCTTQVDQCLALNPIIPDTFPYFYMSTQHPWKKSGSVQQVLENKSCHHKKKNKFTIILAGFEFLHPCGCYTGHVPLCSTGTCAASEVANPFRSAWHAAPSQITNFSRDSDDLQTIWVGIMMIYRLYKWNVLGYLEGYWGSVIQTTPNGHFLSSEPIPLSPDCMIGSPETMDITSCFAWF